MAEIKLTKGCVVIVDDADFEWLNRWSWYAQFNGRGKAYAQRDPDSGRVMMHRLIMNAPSHLQVDHMNGDSLDNRRVNLRLCTSVQNAYNRPKTAKRSAFKGVSRNNVATGGYRAEIAANRQRFLLGTFPTAEAAARAYDAKARELHGAFARLNFPDEAA